MNLNRRFWRACLLLPLLLGALTLRALGHDPGLSTLTAQWNNDRLEIVAAFARSDLGRVLAAQNTTLPAIASNVAHVEWDGQPIAPRKPHTRINREGDMEVRLAYSISATGKLRIRSPLLSGLPLGHRQYATILNAANKPLAERLLSAGGDAIETKQADVPAAAAVFGSFLLLGIEHIAIGYDHILFLFALLIVTSRFADALKIITCFTVAHSLTLAAATLNLAHLPGSLVEPLIAASIVYVGLENLFRAGAPRWRLALTFAFGLVHGFGFASVLQDLGIGATGSGIAGPLVAFNLGVELGQLAIAALALPLLWKARTQPAFVQKWVPACSIVIALAGGYWLLERIL